MRLARIGLAAACLSAAASCSCGDRAGPADAGPPPRTPLLRDVPADAASDPVAFAKALIPARKGACAQVRSIPDELKANEVAEGIRKALKLPVELLRADLGDKGLWFRVCVGDEDSAARLVAKASRWTAPGGELEPFLDEPQEGMPRYFAKERETAESRAPSLAAARTVLGTAVVPGTALYLAGGPAADTLLLAATAEAEGGGTVVVAAGVDGAQALLRGTQVPGCAACELVLSQGGRVSERLVSAGDLWPTPGDELLVEEESATGERLLSVVLARPGQLERVAGILVAKASAGVLLAGVARIVDADTDSQREVVVTTTELHLTGDDGCALESHAALYDATENGLARVDVQAVHALQAAPVAPTGQGPDGGSADAAADVSADSAADSDARTVAAIISLDSAGDHALASRACAVASAGSRPGTTARHCLDRLRTLLAEGDALAATNAGGLLAEAAPGLRALIATPFFSAASVLDADPRLQPAAPDCATAPLVRQVSTRSVDENLRLAAARARERLSLADVQDAVFVTALRDFGADTPVGAIAARWLDRMQSTLPARHAAIEALLLPQAPPASPSTAGPTDGGPSAPAPDGAPGFGGSP